MANKKTPRLNEEQRQEATRRVLAGEKSAALAKEYGVTRAYISLLKAYALYPERYEQLRVSKLTRALTEEQLAEFRTAIETSDPSKLNLMPPTRMWCMDHGYQLAERMFGKRPSVRVMKECMKPVLRIKNDRIIRRPQPPELHHISQLSPEFAMNEEFVEYYLSPLSNKISKREYELALADWEARYGDALEIDLDAQTTPEPDNLSKFSPPLPKSRQRTGKHSKSKGSPFTASKKRHPKKR
jgi:hypothetical protein